MLLYFVWHERKQSSQKERMIEVNFVFFLQLLLLICCCQIRVKSNVVYLNSRAGFVLLLQAEQYDSKYYFYAIVRFIYVKIVSIVPNVIALLMKDFNHNNNGKRHMLKDEIHSHCCRLRHHYYCGWDFWSTDHFLLSIFYAITIRNHFFVQWWYFLFGNNLTIPFYSSPFYVRICEFIDISSIRMGVI